MITVTIETELGDLAVAVDPQRAPLSAGNFLAYVDGGHLDGQAVYRIVTEGNQGPEIVHRIQVVQFGWRGAGEPPLPPIAHEPTGRTGLRHGHGAVSMARRALGTAGPGFFICVGDQPLLDEGGGRHPDGQGFAAFGRVTGGFDTLDRLFARGEAQDQLAAPIGIRRAFRS